MMTVLEIPAHGFGSEGGFWWPFFSLAAACPPCVVSKLRLTKSVSYPPSERRGSTIIPTAMEALGLAQLAHNTDTLERSKQLLIYYNRVIFHFGTSTPKYSMLGKIFRFGHSGKISVFHLGSFWGEIFHFGPCGSTYIPLWHLLWIYSIMSPCLRIYTHETVPK
jgi:hypothetical protein